MSVTLNVTRGLAALLRDRGISTEHFLRSAGLTPDFLARPAPSLGDHDVRRAIRAAYELSGDPALGLELGTHAPPNMLSVAGQLLMTCPTIRVALDELDRFMPLILPGGHFVLREEGDRASLVLEAGPSIAASRFTTELTLSFVLRVGRQFVSQCRTPIEVRVRHDAPSYAEQYREVFGCPTRFGMPHDEIVFHASLLDVPQPFADEPLRLLMRARAEDMLSTLRLRESVHDRVRTILLHDTGLGDVDADTVARRVGMSPRCLRRRLRQEGVLLSDLVDELRREISFRELLQPDMPIKQIADRVGFSEVSAFHRAFKRWTGITPAKYRAQGGLPRAS